MKSAIGALATGIALFVGTTAHGVPLIEESFDGTGYDVAANLVGLNGGTGFSSAWAMDTGMSAVVVSGLSLGNLDVSGNAAQFQRRNNGTANQLHYGNRVLSTGVSSGTVWMSHLTRWDTDFGGGGHEAGLVITGTSDSSGQKLLQNDLSTDANGDNDEFGIGYTQNGANVTRTAITASLSDGNVLGTTYFVVARWTAVDTTSGEAKLWVFDTASAVNNILNAANEAVLDANAVATATLAGTTAAAFQSGDTLSYGGFIGGDGGQYDITIDEIRIGTTAAMVTPEIPEPASLALLGLGGLAILGRRRV